MFERDESGFTLTELLAVVAMIGILIGCATPSWLLIRRRAAVRSAAGEIRSVFHHVRSLAISTSRNTGVQFTRSGGQWQYAIYEDGDRDGVRSDDIRRGTDRCIQPRRHLFQQPQLVSIALLPLLIRDPDGDPLRPSASPVQFNNSRICSFSPLGRATPGTIYLTDSAGSLYAVRVYGASAKMRLLRYEPATSKWEAR